MSFVDLHVSIGTGTHQFTLQLIKLQTLLITSHLGIKAMNAGLFIVTT